jgi:Ca2+/Na+ antiporter
MNISRRVAISIVLITIIFLTGVLFWPFVVNNILEPLALVVWLFLRIFVLSIGQSYYWAAIIFVAAIFLYRLLSYSQTTPVSEESQDWNETINTIGLWHIRFILNNGDPGDDKSLRQELAHLLASLYASKQRGLSNFEIYVALKDGQIPLPEQIHAFLFPGERQESGSFLNKLFQSIRRTPRKWIRQWTGQEKAEKYRMIEEVLGFMETFLEIKK